MRLNGGKVPDDEWRRTDNHSDTNWSRSDWNQRNGNLERRTGKEIARRDEGHLSRTRREVSRPVGGWERGMPTSRTSPTEQPRQVERQRSINLLIASSAIIVVLVITIFAVVPAIRSTTTSDKKPAASTPQALPATPSPSPDAATKSPPSSPVPSAPTSPSGSPLLSNSPAPPSSSVPTLPYGQVSSSTYLSAPVDANGGVDENWNSDEQISGKDYPDSSIFSCPLSQDEELDWNVAGYDTFTAMVGIADSESNAVGKTSDVSFLDQNGRVLGRASIYLGHPESVNIALHGAVRMSVGCAASPSNQGDFMVTLGNGALNRN